MFISVARRLLSFSGGRQQKSHSTDNISKITNFQRKCSKVAGYTSKKGAKMFTVAVEGNIGSGKTTFLQYFSKYANTTAFPEPVTNWRNVRGHNLLGLMYTDPSRWSLTFQTYVQLTMLRIHSVQTSHRIKLMERSLHSARYCFVENLHKAGFMPDAEYVVLDEWFKWLVENGDVSVDLIVYLKTDPEVVFERIKKRCRPEENGITLDYLKKLHVLHEDWLFGRTRFQVPAQLLVLDANQDLKNMEIEFQKHLPEVLFCNGDYSTVSLRADA